VAPAVDCSILIPVYNEERYIEQSWAAMRRQRFDGRLEFLFVDGCSMDRTREILEWLAVADHRVRVLHNPHRTVSSGLNVALAHARGTWVARMDAHTSYPEDYVARGIARLQLGGTRWVSGPQLPKGQGPVSRAAALALASPIGRGGSRKWGIQGEREEPEFELDSGVFCGVWARETLLEYGGWDERWPRNSDSEMAARFLERGERLICVPAMAAEYVPRDSLRTLWKQYRAYGQYRARTSLHHPGAMRISHLLAPAIVATAACTIASPAPIRRLARLGFGGYLAAMGYAGVRSWPQSRSASEAAMIPVVLPIMHFGHGVGTLDGFRRYGVPVAAVAQLAGLDCLAARLSLPPESVYAPSLSRER
jgi:succinoglycan biosynthesis protein ExoA